MTSATMTIPSVPSDAIALKGYELLVCVCGGIAAYKACEVVSAAVQRGAGVTVAMTPSATRFVGPATFQALTGRRVLTSLWHEDAASEVAHIALTDFADLVLVVPATANTVGKIAGGIADEIVSTLVIGSACPVVLAPAMNNRMWSNAAVTANIETLKKRNYRIIEPGEGWLACRSTGPGRMAEPSEILEAVTSMLTAESPKSRSSSST